MNNDCSLFDYLSVEINKIIMDNKKNDAFQSSEFHMKQFSVLDVQEKERQRIARDLHDSSLQDLTHLVHQVELSSLYIDKDPLKAKLELASVESGLRKVIDDIRNRIYDLRPMTFDDLGLRETILNFFSVLNRKGYFEILEDIDDIEDEFSEEEKELSLLMIYRIIQECVQNGMEHSKGNQIKVVLKKKNEFILIEIADNGIGFDLEEAGKKDRHFGLSVVKERVFLLGGEMKIDTEHGTTVSIEIPRKKNKSK